MPPVDEKVSGSVADSATTERRRNLRFPITASVEVTESLSGARITGRTSDLGLGGCYIDAISPFPVGAETKVRITRGKESFEAQAKVIYSRIGMGMGVAFVSAQPKQVRLFQRWLLEISGKSDPLPDPPEQEHKEEAAGNLQDKRDYILNELLTVLMRKGVLTEVEGKAMLKKLLQ